MKSSMSLASHTRMISMYARFHPVSFVSGQVMTFEKQLLSHEKNTLASTFADTYFLSRKSGPTKPGPPNSRCKTNRMARTRILRICAF
ncbi:hypothetical protein U3A58_00310 [Algoriphagus sp. C2-6-M1]|nr:hypothetical protein [Algoriphagus sp. C2-6-M1]